MKLTSLEPIGEKKGEIRFYVFKLIRVIHILWTGLLPES